MPSPEKSTIFRNWSTVFSASAAMACKLAWGICSRLRFEIR